MTKTAEQKVALVMAGGTGGHIFPALAVADYLLEKGMKVVWLGTEWGLEASIIPKRGYEIEYLKVKGIRGNGIARKIISPFMILKALIQALGVVNKLKPNVVLGMGGYVTGPGGVAAKLLGKKLVIHEQNAVPGLTNRWLSKIADRVFEAFPSSFEKTGFGQKSQIVFSGNPLRKEFVDYYKRLKETQQEYNGDSNGISDKWFSVLIVGGSLGAKVLNEIVPKGIRKLSEMVDSSDIRVLHQAGEKTLNVAYESYKEEGVDAQVVPFIDDMIKAYSDADVVICRAGALTVSEIAAIGVPAIFVPLPHAVDDHQTKNASYLSRNGAAVLIPQNEFTEERLSSELKKLLDKSIRKDMRDKLKELVEIKATEMVAEYCLEAA